MYIGKKKRYRNFWKDSDLTSMSRAPVFLFFFLVESSRMVAMRCETMEMSEGEKRRNNRAGWENSQWRQHAYSLELAWKFSKCYLESSEHAQNLRKLLLSGCSVTKRSRVGFGDSREIVDLITSNSRVRVS